MRRTRAGIRIAATFGSLAMVIAGTTSVASAQTSWEVVASGLDNPRHLTFSATGDLYVAEAGKGGSARCAVHPELGEFCLGFTGAVTQIRDDGPDDKVLTGLPSILGESGDALGPSDIAFTGGQKFVLSIGLGGSEEFRADFGDDGPCSERWSAARSRRMGTRCSPTSWPTRRRLILTAPTSIAIPSDSSGRARVTSWPMRAVMPSCGRRTRARLPRLPCCRRGPPWLLPSSGYRPAPRSPPMPCQPRWSEDQTALTTSAS